MDKLMCIAVYLIACQLRTFGYVLNTGYLLCCTRPMSWRRATHECFRAGGTPFSVHTHAGPDIAIKPSLSVWTADVLTLHTDTLKHPDMCAYRMVTPTFTVDGVRDCNDVIHYLCCQSDGDSCNSNVKIYNGTREEAKRCTKIIRVPIPPGDYWLLKSYDILTITADNLLNTASGEYCGSLAADITYAACGTELHGLCTFSYPFAPIFQRTTFDDSCFSVTTSSLTPTASYTSTRGKSSNGTTKSATIRPTRIQTLVSSGRSDSTTASQQTTLSGTETSPALLHVPTQSSQEPTNTTQHANMTYSPNDPNTQKDDGEGVVVIVVPIVAILVIISGVGIAVFFLRRRMNGKKADTNTTACPTARHNETYELDLRPSQETAIVSRKQSSRTATDYEQVDQENKYYELDLKSDAYSYSDEREDAGNYYNINQSTRPEEPVYDHTLTSHTKQTPGLHHDHGENEYNTFADSKEVDFVGDSAIYDSTDQKQMKTNQVTENVYNTLQTDTAEGMYNSTSDWKQGTKAQNATYDSVTH